MQSQRCQNAFNSVEFAWNSVDVLGSDGLLHNGRVVDAFDEGLVVHFGGTGHSGPRLILLENVYHRNYANYLTELGQNIDEGVETLTEERPVEVLLRLQPEDPWTWYPGMLLQAFGLVSVTLPDRQLKGFAVEERIRQRSTEHDLGWLEIEEGRFSRRLIAVPNEVGASFASDDQLVEAFNDLCRQRHYWMMATHMLNNVHHGLFKEMGVLGIFGEDEEELETCLYYGRNDYVEELEVNELEGVEHHGGRISWCTSVNELLLSLLTNAAGPLENVRFLSPAVPCPDVNIQFIYRDPSIFPEIIQCLTTLQQSELRGVCGHWDAILTSPYIRSFITVSFPCSDPSCYGPDYTRNMYRYASCVFNCWTRETRMLVLYGDTDDHRHQCHCDSPLGGTAQFLQRILVGKGLPAAKVFLLAGEWGFRVNASNWIIGLHEVFASLAGVSQEVVMVGVEVNMLLERSGRYKLKEESIDIRFPGKRIIRQLTINDFCAMLNNGLRDLNAREMRHLAEWIGRSSIDQRIFWKAAQILNITQTLDSRNGVRYRGMSFSNDVRLDGIDVRHLTKLTLHALIQRKKWPGCTIIFHVV